MLKSKISFALFLSFVLLFFVTIPNTVLADTSGTLLPTSDGTYTQWTPSTGTTHYTLVDETTCNGVTDYAQTSTLTARDSYGLTLTTVPNGATITQISLTPCASKNTGGGAASTINVFYRVNGANSVDAGGYSVNSTTPSVLTTTSYNGLSTIKSSTTTLEVGAVYSAGSKGARLSQIATTITYTPLQAPTVLTGSVGTEAANLSWTDNATNEDGFKIERSTDNVNFTQIGTTSANVTTYTDNNVIGQSYYRVRAYNSGGDSAYTNTLSLNLPLQAPTSLSVSASGADALLSWVDNSMNEDGFKIERSTDSAHFTQINFATQNATSYTDFSRPSGTWYYRVRAYKTSINSVYSNIASVIIP